MSFTSLLARQIAFSRATFGPNERTEGVLDHITKEQKEVRDSHDAFARALEWTDIHMLARDGHWRAVAQAFPEANTDQIAKIVEEQLTEKLDKNERRDWPDWRTADESKAIEHVENCDTVMFKVFRLSIVGGYYQFHDTDTSEFPVRVGVAVSELSFEKGRYYLTMARKPATELGLYNK